MLPLVVVERFNSFSWTRKNLSEIEKYSRGQACLPYKSLITAENGKARAPRLYAYKRAVYFSQIAMRGKIGVFLYQRFIEVVRIIGATLVVGLF